MAFCVHMFHDIFFPRQNSWYSLLDGPVSIQQQYASQDLLQPTTKFRFDNPIIELLAFVVSFIEKIKNHYFCLFYWIFTTLILIIDGFFPSLSNVMFFIIYWFVLCLSSSLNDLYGLLMWLIEEYCYLWIVWEASNTGV